MSSVQVDSDILDRLKKMQDDFNANFLQRGHLEYQILDIQNSLDELVKTRDKLLKNYHTLRESEKKLTTEIETQYGSGRLDLDTGLFTPNPKKI